MNKEAQLESEDELRRRIHEAAEYVPFEHLAVSTQCGFASAAPGNLISWDDQPASSNWSPGWRAKSGDRIRSFEGEGKIP